MRHVEGSFRGAREARIYHQGWLPEGDAGAVLLVVHGIGEHSGRYGNVVNHFVPRGYAVYGFDHIGHGRSDGRREFVERFADYTETLAIYVNLVRGWQPGKPVFLLAHSMGGLIASYYLLDHPADFRGAVLSAPALKISDDISPATLALGRILSVLAPRMGLAALEVGGLSRDPEVVVAYVKDPLVFHGRTPARLVAESLRAMQRVAAEAARIALPFMVVQGGADRMVDPAGAQLLHDKAGSNDKTLRVYEGLYHELFNEPERARVLADVEQWLAAHL